MYVNTKHTCTHHGRTRTQDTHEIERKTRFPFAESWRNRGMSPGVPYINVTRKRGGGELEKKEQDMMIIDM